MPSVPSTTKVHYSNLTSDERDDFLRLFTKATGVPLREPAHDTLGGWIDAVFRAADPHVDKMRIDNQGFDARLRANPDLPPTYCTYDPGVLLQERPRPEGASK